MEDQELLSFSPATRSLLHTPQSNCELNDFGCKDSSSLAQEYGRYRTSFKIIKLRNFSQILHSDPRRCKRPSTPVHISRQIAPPSIRKRTKTGRFTKHDDSFDAPTDLGFLFRNAQDKIMALHKKTTAAPKSQLSASPADEDLRTNLDDMIAHTLASSSSTISPWPAEQVSSQADIGFWCDSLLGENRDSDLLQSPTGSCCSRGRENHPLAKSSSSLIQKLPLVIQSNFLRANNFSYVKQGRQRGKGVVLSTDICA